MTAAGLTTRDLSMQTRPRLAEVRANEPARGHEDVTFSQRRTETDAPRAEQRR